MPTLHSCSQWYLSAHVCALELAVDSRVTVPRSPVPFPRTAPACVPEYPAQPQDVSSEGTQTTPCKYTLDALEPSVNSHINVCDFLLVVWSLNIS